MKSSRIITGIAACALALSIVGCKKEEPGVPATTNQVEKAADAVADKAKEVGTEIKEGAEKAATEVKDAVKGTADSASAQADSIIKQAKDFVAEKKYQDALNSLSGLANFKLTPEQQKTVDDLKAQIQKAMAASGMNGLMGK